MELTKQDIIFIDTYLKKAEICFTDVRMEMVDHIATAVSNKMKSSGLTFYDAFKQYMIVNKKELLKQNKQFIKTTDKSVFMQWVKNFITTFNLLVMLCSFILLIQYVTSANKSIFSYVPFILLCVIYIFYLVLTRYRKKQRFSGLERLGFILVLFFQMFYLFINPFFKKTVVINNDFLFTFFIVFFIGLSTAYLKTALDLNKKYTNQYNIVNI